MPDSLNLNSIPKIMPKEDSWNKVLLRINAEKGAKKNYSLSSIFDSLRSGESFVCDWGHFLRHFL